ncbi:MAG: ABC transporter substrate-binding protein, partial [Coriobacteriales bacterium]|nr:ABC transporter substrate-binding protein [Coriobacteriales bacterium]
MKHSTLKKWLLAAGVALATAGLCIALAGCDNGMPVDGAGGGDDATNVEPATRTITDMAGREVTIPTHPTRVLGAANPDGMIIYSIDPNLMVGWVNGVSDRAKPYLTPEAAALPKVTSVSKWEDPNEEELLSLNLDFILVSVDLNNTDYSLYDKITADTGIPVVVIDAELNNWGTTYRFLANIFPDQAEQCYACAALAEEFTIDIT